MPRPRPSEKRPPVRRCIVNAYEAVISGWRVFWFVAAVAMPSSVEQAAAAPESVAASLMLKRSEMNTEPKPIASPARTSSNNSAGDSGWPARV